MRENKSSIISHGDIGKRMPSRNVKPAKIAWWASPEQWVSKGRFSLAWAWAIASAPVRVKVVKVGKRI